MNKEKQRIAIAEFCGWRQSRNCKDKFFPPTAKPWPNEGCFACPTELPDYLNDLNAMHEAEKGLTAHQWEVMFSLLIKIRWRDASEEERKGSGNQLALSPARATAEQRAEALLKTIGRWEDESE